MGGQYTKNEKNEGVAGYLRSESISYGATSDSHLAVLLDSQVSDQSDTDGWLIDWVQGGYAIGSVDQTLLRSEVMYSEVNDINTTSKPSLHTFPAYGLGNQYFQSSFSGVTGPHGRGIYDMFNGTRQLAYGWLIDPENTQQIATVESWNCSRSTPTPSTSGSLFGTTGSAGQYDTASQLAIYPHGGGNEFWGTNIDTARVPKPGEFSLDYTVHNSVFKVNGHGA